MATEPQTLVEQGVRVSFVEFENVTVELMEPLGETSPITRFLDRSPAGGMHHICFEVTDIWPIKDRLSKAGVRVLGDGEPKKGAHGNPVIFAHPSDLFGVLTEFEEIR